MMHIYESPDPGQVVAFCEIRKQWREQLKQGLFYAEGEQVFLRLLQSEVEIVSVLMTHEYFEKYSGLLEKRADTIFIAKKGWIEANTFQKLNQGLLALAKIPEPIPVSYWTQQSRCCIVALNGIDHAVNVGAILRNCAAFNVSAVITDEDTVSPFCWRAVKSSIGGVFQVPVVRNHNFFEALKMFQESGFSLIAADPSATEMLSFLQPSEKSCLILGNEHQGLSASVLSLAPHCVAIPLSGKVDSLNVAAASAVFLHELQHRLPRPKGDS